MGILLIGAGGHAKAIVEALEADRRTVTHYVDPNTADWLDAEHLTRDEEAEPDLGGAVMGIGGIGPKALRGRLKLFDAYATRGFEMPKVLHPRAIQSASARLYPGVIVLAGAIVQPGVRISRAAIVNTGTIVEHDSEIGPGAHIGPGAIVLGSAQIGRCAMIGAGAVILPGAKIEDFELVPALSRSAGHKTTKADPKPAPDDAI